MARWLYGWPRARVTRLCAACKFNQENPSYDVGGSCWPQIRPTPFPRAACSMSEQHRHLELAKRMKNSAEEQRACTQLGRAYLDVFIRSEDQRLHGGSQSRKHKEGEEGDGDNDGMDPGKALVEAKNFLESALQIAKQMLMQNRGRGGPGRNQQRSGGRPALPNGRAQGLNGDEGFTGHAHRSSGSGAGSGGVLGAEALADAYLNVGVLFEETEDVEEALKCCCLALQVGCA